VLGLLPGPAHAQDPDPGGGRGGAVVQAIRQIATLVIDIMIGTSVVLMAVGIATGFVGGQFLVTVGQPYGLSSAWVKVISVVILGLGALLTITIVNTIINALSGLVPPTQIPSL
jgi:CBS domain containing-hemolysin-like protein